ncbi:MAG TPA: O-antigen polysaccharide polymerase Wzy, partial [Aggregatilineales bacterium]|nr:O-antigen polysaccharide polymerase Wzy [Aggregatilineales bacterium]
MLTKNSALSPSLRRRSGLLVLVHGLIVILLLTIYLIAAEYYSPEALIYPACVCLVALFFWELWSWNRIAGALLNPYILFLVAATLFNGGQAFLEIFGLNRGGILNGRFDSQTILNTVVLVTLSLGMLHLGALIAVTSSRTTARKQLPLTPITPQDIRIVGWLMLAVSVVPTILRLRDAITVVQSSGYSALYQQAVFTGVGASSNILASFFVPALLFLLAGHNNQKEIIALSAVCILVYSTTEVMLGHRGWGLLPLFAYAWLWHRVVHPLPWTLIVIGILVVFVIIFPLVSAARNTRGEERWSLSYLSNAFNSIENPVLSSLSEIGGTMQISAYMLDFVPSQQDYQKGLTYFYAFTTIFPNFFWDVHPAIAYGLPEPWLTRLADPWLAEQGGGLGFSFIAE